MATYYDDNFGHYDEESMETEDGRLFYEQMQRESVEKRCEGCGRMVRLRPEYYICTTCADTLERGGDLAWPDMNDQEE